MNERGSASPARSRSTGHWCQGVAWSKNNETLLVQCMVEKEIMVFGFDGRNLSARARDRYGKTFETGNRIRRGCAVLSLSL